MTELIQNASDDQIALALCVAAVTVSGLVMYFSYHVGVVARTVRSRAAALSVASSRPTRQAVPVPARDKAA